MRTVTRFLIVIIFLALVFGGIFGYKIYQVKQMQANFSGPPPPAIIEVTTASSESWRQSLKSVGTLTAVNGIEVANEVPGIAKRVLFESGDRVKEGDTLLEMDSASDQAAVRTRRAEAGLAAQGFSRVEGLLPKNAVSQSQYDEAQANLEAARARVNEAEAQLSKKALVAPFAGVLGLRLVDQGQYLPTGTPIVEINMLDPIYVDYSVSEKELANIGVADEVAVTVAAVPDHAYHGKISAINSSVNAQSRTVRIRATLANPERKLQPGMFATVQTLRPTAQNVVAIPRTAISFNTYGDYVYVVTQNEEDQLVVERRSVITGSARDSKVDVIENLAPGERVVATGLLRLRNGQQVEIADDSEAGTVESPSEKGLAN